MNKRSNTSGNPRNAAQGKNTVVIPISELHRIRDSIQPKPSAQIQREQEVVLLSKRNSSLTLGTFILGKQKKTLKAKADERVKNWPNTIQGLRQRKEAARIEQFKKEEMERRKVDEEEAAYRAKLRADTILQANQKIFMEHDKVKSMQTKLLLSDAIKERELQVDINRRKQNLNKEIEEAQHQDVLEWCKEYDDKEATQAMREREKKAEQQKVLKKQHEEFIHKRVNRLREEKVEGQIVKIKAEEAVEEEKMAELQRKNQLLKAQAETKKANEELERIREQLRQKEKEEDEKIEEFRKNKEDMISLRAQREAQRFREKQAARQKIIDAQIENLKRIKNKEDEILNKQIKEAEIKAEENERIKKEKRDALKVTPNILSRDDLPIGND